MFDPKTANSLLRSAHAIASREGRDTNWEAFKRNLEKALCAQTEVDVTNPEHVKHATCTPLTYRTFPGQ
jgi:hypothetical protein